MDGRMFDGLISGLLLMGAAMGVILCAVLWGIYWLLSHIQLTWVS